MKTCASARCKSATGGNFKQILLRVTKSVFCRSRTDSIRSVHDYVLLNLVRAKLFKPDGPLANVTWSGYGDRLKPPARHPGRLRVDRLPGEKGIPKDRPSAAIKL